MSTILPKHQMSEEDIKLQYITPALLSKWNREKITMETRITDCVPDAAKRYEAEDSLPG